LKLRPYRAGLKVGSVQRRLNAIAQALKAMGLDSPTSAGMLRNKLKGPRRKRPIGTARAGKIGMPYGSNPETCPARTDQAWLAEASADAGPLFRSINRHG
jgi:hypothetical protein